MKYQQLFFLLLLVNEPASELSNQTQPGGLQGFGQLISKDWSQVCRQIHIRCVVPQRPRPLPLTQVAERKTGGDRNTQRDENTSVQLWEICAFILLFIFCIA